MATIRKRGNLQWQAIVKRRGYPLTSRTFETKKDAEAWARATERDIDLGQFLPNRDAERMLLHDLIERYRRDVLPSKRGAHFGTSLRVLDEHLGRYSLAAITSKVVADFRDARLHQGLASSTVKQEVNFLSRLIDLAGKEWGVALPVNPCKMVSRPIERNARERRLEKDEEPYLLAACSPPLAALVRLAIETAARSGELLSLRWDDVDLEKRVAITRGIDRRLKKNGDPLSSAAIAALDAAQRRTKNGDPLRALLLSTAAVAVFKGLPRTGDRVFHWKASDSIYKLWTRTIERATAAYAADCKRSGRVPRKGFLVGLRFHDLRHEAISRLFERGKLSIMEIADFAGHKTLAMAKRYTHLRAEDQAKKLD
jgi:integrase